MDNSQLPLSNHAQERMAERGITMPMLRAVLRHGEASPAYDTSERIRLCDVIAVVDRGLVVTVFSQPTPIGGRISPKRMARMPGQARRRIQRIYARKGYNAVELVDRYGD